jgi:hypothetical protein
MADYKNIKGFNIQYLDSDPPNPIEGQMWFNSTTQTLKGAEAGGAPAGTWSSGGNLNQSRFITSGAGRGYTPSASAALIIGGRTAPGAYVGSTELYNGSSWTELNDLNTVRDQLGSSGTSTSAIAAGGYDNTVLNSSESWNGTSWTSTPSLNQARYEPGSSGESNTSALRFGGFNCSKSWSWCRFCFRSFTYRWSISNSLCRNSILQWYKLVGSCNRRMAIIAPDKYTGPVTKTFTTS